MLTSIEVKVDKLSRDFEKSSAENIGLILREIQGLNEELKEELSKPSLTKDFRAAAIGEALGFIVKILFPQLN